ncbi:MAG: sprT-like family protein [Bacillales bacterium]|jgi:SprT-like protein|nr:sprT-like family protein [Bacillales bacterium]
MDNQDLQELVKMISVKYFNLEFKHTAYFNNRLRTTGGRYLLASGNIEINPKQYVDYGIDEIISIIKHELCHYHLHQQGKGYRHSDENFKQLLKKVEGPRFCKPLKKTSFRNRKIQKYVCTECERLYSRKRKINTQKYRCGVCYGILKFVETVEIK